MIRSSHQRLRLRIGRQVFFTSHGESLGKRKKYVEVNHNVPLKADFYDSSVTSKATSYNWQANVFHFLLTCRIIG